MAEAVKRVTDKDEIPDGYITGLVRDFPYARISHLYKGTFAESGNPMCKRGWNRVDGEGYSIWRGNVGTVGICKICMRRALKGLDGIK